MRNDWAEGMAVRPDTSDADVIAEQEREYGHAPWRGKIVVDIGANIGAFARFARSRGAVAVRSIEPDPDNFRQLRRNLAGVEDTVSAFSAAVVPVAGITNLYLAPSAWSHSTVPYRGRSTILSVLGIELMEATEPINRQPVTAVKCDIEGAEWSLPWGEVMRKRSAISLVVMELHLTRSEWRTRACPRLMEEMDDAGFTVDDNTIPPRAWNMVRTWWR